MQVYIIIHISMHTEYSSQDIKDLVNKIFINPKSFGNFETFCAQNINSALRKMYKNTFGHSQDTGLFIVVDRSHNLLGTFSVSLSYGKINISKYEPVEPQFEIDKQSFKSKIEAL